VNTFLEVRTATIVSLAAKKEISHLAPKRILRASKSFSTSLLQTLGVILLFVLLLQLLAPWPSRPSFQNHTWKKTFPSSTSHLEKTTCYYDAASGSSLYCNGDPVNGLDPDGRCVEGMVTGQSYNIPSYAGALMGRMNPFFSTTQQLYSTAQTYNANYETFGESHWNAINTTFNPAYAMIKGGYEATTGFGVSPNNLGQDLSVRQRIGSGVESVLGAVGTFGIAFGVPEVMGGGGAVSVGAIENTSTALSTFRYTSEGETFFHYAYAENIANFRNGLRPGAFATTVEKLSGKEAQNGLALPAGRPIPNAVYKIYPQPGTLIKGNPVAEPLFGRPGGLPEYQFPLGTGPGTVSEPTLIQ